MPDHLTFQLPRGYMDSHGGLHCDGEMRPARAIDELAPLTDPRVRANEALLSVLVLSRVVLRIGTLQKVTPEVIQSLYSEDFAALQELYMRLNSVGRAHRISTWCPLCRHSFDLDLDQGLPPTGPRP